MQIITPYNTDFRRLRNLPTWLNDGTSNWGDLVGIPDNILFLANSKPPSWNPWVLSSFYGYYLEWMPLVSTSQNWTMVQRDGFARVRANNFIADNMPLSADSLSSGMFWRNGNNVMIV